MNQVKKMRWLEAGDNTPVMSRDRDFSSWGNPSEPAYTTPQDKLNILKQLRITPADQITLRTNRQDPSYPHKHQFPRSRITKDQMRR